MTMLYRPKAIAAQTIGLARHRLHAQHQPGGTAQHVESKRRTVPGVGTFSEALPLTAGGTSTRWSVAGVAAPGQALLASCTTSWLPCAPTQLMPACTASTPSRTAGG